MELVQGGNAERAALLTALGGWREKTLAPLVELGNSIPETLPVRPGYPLFRRGRSSRQVIQGFHQVKSDLCVCVSEKPVYTK